MDKLSRLNTQIEAMVPKTRALEKLVTLLSALAYFSFHKKSNLPTIDYKKSRID
jgi:hypothetical protein